VSLGSADPADDDKAMEAIMGGFSGSGHSKILAPSGRGLLSKGEESASASMDVDVDVDVGGYSRERERESQREREKVSSLSGAGVADGGGGGDWVKAVDEVEWQGAPHFIQVQTCLTAVNEAVAEINQYVLDINRGKDRGSGIDSTLTSNARVTLTEKTLDKMKSAGQKAVLLGLVNMKRLIMASAEHGKKVYVCKRTASPTSERV